MKVFTCTEFTGYYPVGTAAVVVANDVTEAKEKLEEALAGMIGLGQTLTEDDFVEVVTDEVGVTILLDGNY